MSVKENIKISNQIISLHVFGSVARGDADSQSDLDILAVIINNRKPPEQPVRDYIQQIYGKKSSISWYSYKRIKELYQQGHLFAWHIFLESKEIAYTQEPGIIRQLGKPSKYATAHEDIASLIDILSSINDAIRQCPRNAIYEAGLIYVCARNIALSTSSFTSEGLDFSRYSPYNLNIGSFSFPIPLADYELLIQARHSSMRGGNPPRLEVSNLLSQQRDVLRWSKKIQNYFKGINCDF